MRLGDQRAHVPPKEGNAVQLTKLPKGSVAWWLEVHILELCCLDSNSAAAVCGFLGKSLNHSVPVFLSKCGFGFQSPAVAISLSGEVPFYPPATLNLLATT